MAISISVWKRKVLGWLSLLSTFYTFHMKQNSGVPLTCQPQANVLLLSVSCSLLALSAALCPRDWHPLLALQEDREDIALTLSLGSFHERHGFSLVHTFTGSLLQPRLAMKWKTGWWTSHDVFQKAKMGMCSVLVRNRDLLGSRNSVNLDSKMEISAGRPERTWVLTICIVYLWGAFCSNCLLLLEQDPNPPNTLQRELQCPTTASAMQPLQCLTTELEAEVAPN